jgi:hypothetical protein
VFVSCFALLYRVVFAVIALGGSCASGGPYAIEVECPSAVVLFAPLSILGGFLAVGIAFLFAQGFATPLVVWAWPILFVGLSIPFFVSGAMGSVGSIVIGVLFLAMGVAPLWLLLRMPEARLLLLGTRNVHGRNFIADTDKSAYRLLGRRPGANTDPVPATGADWALSLGVVAAAILCGLAAADWLWWRAG